MTRELTDHITISHYLGSNPSYVQAGGGNTSIKSGASEMLIKSSGVPLRDMSETKGWVKLSIPAIMALYDDADLRQCAPAEREKRVLDYFYRSVVEPQGARPSVETPLHAILGHAVIHSHAVAANALTCNINAEEMFQAIALDVKGPPSLFVPYVDPGASLAFLLREKIREYQQAHTVSPRVIFLENHGFVCADDTAAGCIGLHEAWMARLEAYFGAPEELKDSLSAAVLDVKAIRAAFEKITAERKSEPLVVRECNGLFFQLAASSKHLQAFEGALAPDYVVYNGPAALFLAPGFTEKEVYDAIAGYAAFWKRPPKLIIVKGAGLVVAGASEKLCAAGEACAQAVLQISLLAKGRVKSMAPATIKAILTWEAESYRSAQLT